MKNLFANFWFQIALVSGLFVGTLINEGIGALIWFTYCAILMWYKPINGNDMTE